MLTCLLPDDWLSFVRECFIIWSLPFQSVSLSTGCSCSLADLLQNGSHSRQGRIPSVRFIAGLRLNRFRGNGAILASPSLIAMIYEGVRISDASRFMQWVTFYP